MKRTLQAMLVSGLLAQIGLSAPNPVHWSVSGVPGKAVAKGTSFTVKLKAEIDSGWHLYGLEQVDGGPTPLDISMAADTSALSLGALQASKPTKLMDPNFNAQVNVYVTKAEFRLPLEVSSQAKEGAQRGQIAVRYQSCNDTMCLPPKTSTVDVPITVK